MSDNALPALCQFTTLCVSKQKAILLCQNEARSDCIHPNLRAIFPRHVNRQPLSEVCHCCFRCTICRYTGQRTQCIHGCHIDNTALPSFGHPTPEHLTTEERPHKIQPENAINSLQIKIEEALLN